MKPEDFIQKASAIANVISKQFGDQWTSPIGNDVEDSGP